MNLTIRQQKSNIDGTVAKSTVGLDRSFVTGRKSAALIAVFLCVAFTDMVGAMGTPSGVLHPVTQSVNPVVSTTLCLTAPRGSFYKLTQETIMSKTKPTGQNRPQITDLPFYSQNYAPAIYWRVDPTGDYAKDCATGQQYASAALDYIIQTNHKPLLGWIVKDMIEIDNFGGIEVGFMSKICEKATTQHRFDYTFNIVKQSLDNQKTVTPSKIADSEKELGGDL